VPQVIVEIRVKRLVLTVSRDHLQIEVVELREAADGPANAIVIERLVEPPQQGIDRSFGLEFLVVAHKSTVASNALDGWRQILFLDQINEFGPTALVGIDGVHSSAEAVSCDAVLVPLHIEIHLDVVSRGAESVDRLVLPDDGLGEIVDGEVGLLIVVADRVVRLRGVFEPECIQGRSDERIFDTTFRELTEVGSLKGTTVFDDLIESRLVHPVVERFEQIHDVPVNLRDTFFDFS
jgi:hypothetical protein